MNRGFAKGDGFLVPDNCNGEVPCVVVSDDTHDGKRRLCPAPPWFASIFHHELKKAASSLKQPC